MAIDSCLATIMARGACLAKGRMTMETILKSKAKLELDLSGLKA